jgi:hypothetical protein
MEEPTLRGAIMKTQSNHPVGAGTAAKVAYRTVKIDGLDIFYREAGQKNAAAVLLLHGLAIH